MSGYSQQDTPCGNYNETTAKSWVLTVFVFGDNGMGAMNVLT